MSYGIMCSIDDAIEWIQTKTLKSEDMPDRIVSRLKYIRDKDVGVKPKYHKGVYGKKFDSWSCGHCGTTLTHDVLNNFCHECGYRILWDNPRCLTGMKDPT